MLKKAPDPGLIFLSKMITAILGLKVKQAQTFTPDGRRINVTDVITNPCYLVDIKTAEKDGYKGVVLGLGVKRIKHIAKAPNSFIIKPGIKNLYSGFSLFLILMK